MMGILLPLSLLTAADWKIEAIKAGLSAKEIATLERDRFLITRNETLQSFSPYINPAHCTFVTSDVVLNAYHVLFEETIKQIENQNASKLEKCIQGLWKALLKVHDDWCTGDADLRRNASTHARFVIGVTHRLLGGKCEGASDSLLTQIQTEVDAIEAAVGTGKSEIFGGPEPTFIAFDYTLFRPAGFYTASDTLSRYFRAIRWLQLVPFRAAFPAEMLSLATLNEAVGSRVDPDGLSLSWSIQQLDDSWSAVGVTKRWKSPLFKMAQSAGGSAKSAPLEDHIAAMTQMTRDFSEPPEGNDRLRSPPDAAAKEIECRLRPAFVLPEDAAIRAVRPDAQISGGLVFATWLGLPLAEELLLAARGQDVFKKVTNERPVVPTEINDPFASQAKNIAKSVPWEGIDSDGTAVISQMSALRSLWKHDPRLPAMFQSEAWQHKTLMTVASSWAQHRHTWSLQARPDVNYLSGTQVKRAFVEPVPDFFSKLSQVCDTLAAAGLENDPKQVVQDQLASSIPVLENRASDDPMTITALMQINGISHAIRMEQLDCWNPEFDPKTAIPRVRELQAFFANPESKMPDGLIHIAGELRRPLEPLWHSLSKVCLRLALGAEKQLKLQELEPGEARWLSRIGEHLAEFMLYRGNSYLTPEDDAPRIARIASDPLSGEVFHAAIGRPRVGFFLYPWKGEDVFCVGSVLPYHDIAFNTTLIDSEWIHALSGSDRVGIPPWMQPWVPVSDISLAK
ncbi:MAG: DUF3160 domain-containing protein [Verrucomicrobiales bacterium]|nr:DUF3160 domain-containing protein [Verrucomicrobiales bacterium]